MVLKFYFEKRWLLRSLYSSQCSSKPELYWDRRHRYYSPGNLALYLEQIRNKLKISGKFVGRMTSNISKVLMCAGGGSVLKLVQKGAQRSNY